MRRSARPGRLLVGLVTVFSMLSGSVPAAAAPDDGESRGSLLLIMDASGSMDDTDDTGTRLLDGAKQALNRLIAELPDGSRVGLRMYGHRTPNTDRAVGCQDTELVAPVAPLDRVALTAAVNGFEASGYTPIGRSLAEAERDLPPGPATIVLVSDGVDTCAPPDPCEVARDLVARGIDVRIETVGFFLRGEPRATEQLTCIAEATDGSFRTADDASELADELVAVSVRALRQFQPGGSTVEGAPAAVDAPVLEPGTYTDTVLADEASWYGVELDAGELLVVTVTRAGLPDARPEARNYLEVLFADPDFDEANSASEGGYAREVAETTAAHTVRIVTGRVGVDRAPPANLDGDVLQPGIYSVRVVQESVTSPEAVANREIPVEITLEVQGTGNTVDPSGTASGASSPEASPPATSASDTSSRDTAEPVSDDRTASATMIALIVTTTLAAVLLVLVAVLVGRLRRRSGPPTA